MAFNKNPLKKGENDRKLIDYSIDLEDRIDNNFNFEDLTIGGWQCRKYNNGYFLAEMEVSQTEAMTIMYGTLYRTDGRDLSFPITFINYPTFTIQTRTGRIMSCGFNTFRKNEAKYYLIGVGNATENMQYIIKLEGFWK